MSGMDGLADFLATRYDEAEEMAQDLARSYPGPWSADHSWVSDAAGNTVVHDEYHWSALPYIAANDPADRLADIALKRAILADIARICEVSNDLGSFRLAVRTMRQLGTEFDKHADWRPGWAP